ncbi:MAG TPA: carboxypeptidase-like regulatory domain-containing protein [Chitinophagaceae bacterium]|nr:carboxypeptidase-like regulatory domain-containing protein [Chitinophagaceae bacterium]
MKNKLLLLSFFTVLISLSAKAGIIPGDDIETTRKQDVVGGVYDNTSKKPLSNVTVTAYLVAKKEKTVLTDANGHYSFDDLKPGTYKFVFEKDGFKKVSKEKIIARVDEAYQVNINMDQYNSFDFMPGPSQFFDFE